ncbi:MAG: matrixin family metalloprotease [Planctomycetes bacterium]|nr:matrixin family metalloprotease [Planctomycetota bacterium]
MQGGTQRFIDGDIGPLTDLIDTIRQALPPGTVPDEITPYTGKFTFQGGAIPFVVLPCTWSDEVNPMEEGYRINGNCTGPGCGSSQLAIEAINRGADVWNNAGADFYINYLDTSTAQAFALDSVHLIYFEQAAGLGGQTVAATFFWCSGSNMIHWDIAFNDFNFNFWDGVTGACSGRFDIQAVAAHEFGHTLGLDHSPFNGATMFASVGACNLAPRTLHSDDIAGIEFIYGSGLTSLPFFDDFPSSTFENSKWIGIDGAASNTRGINEPSCPNSANIKGQVDGGGQLLSAFMDLSGIPGTTLTYSYQRKGNVDPPEPGDDLLVEYASTSGFWVELNRHLGDGPDMTTYEFVSLDLPAGALHDDFRFRFRVLSSQQGLDNWFVDDVGVDAPPPCPADLDGDGSSQSRTCSCFWRSGGSTRRVRPTLTVMGRSRYPTCSCCLPPGARVPRKRVRGSGFGNDATVGPTTRRPGLRFAQPQPPGDCRQPTSGWLGLSPDRIGTKARSVR